MRLYSDCSDIEAIGFMFSEMDYEVLEDDFKLDFYPKRLKSILVTDELSDGHLIALGSTDGREYGILAGLRIDGKPIDLVAFADAAQDEAMRWREYANN